MTPVRHEPAAPRSRVKYSTTEPLRSLKSGWRTLSFNNSCLKNPYQYGYTAVSIVSIMRLEPVTTCIRVMFASHYTIKIVARGCRFFMFKFIFRFDTISYTVYNIIHSEFGF